MNRFAEYLLELRRENGDLSQDEVIRRAKKLSRGGKSNLSKSTLSLYERGEVTRLRPDIARTLAAVYGCPYQELVSRWVQEEYQTSLSIEHDSFVSEASRDHCLLKTFDDDGSLSLLTVDAFKKTQQSLPADCEVGVSAISFLDNDVFFEMVSANIARGIDYYYLLPEEERISYKLFIARVAERYPNLRRALDGRRTHFIPRVPADLPANYTIYIFPDGRIEGYVGLLYDRRVQYFYATDPGLSLRLYQVFSFAMTIAKDSESQQRLHELHRKTVHRSLGLKRPSLRLAAED